MKIWNKTHEGANSTADVKKADSLRINHWGQSYYYSTAVEEGKHCIVIYPSSLGGKV